MSILSSEVSKTLAKYLINSFFTLLRTFFAFTATPISCTFVTANKKYQKSII